MGDTPKDVFQRITSCDLRRAGGMRGMGQDLTWKKAAVAITDESHTQSPRQPAPLAKRIWAV
jgi:hypothetical protein